jgi:hypothetical protein
MKRDRIVYYASTGLLTLLMLFSAGMYILNNEVVQGMFTNFGYPTYIIYPLAIAKLLGVFAIWNTKFNALKEWAYAGFLFDFVLAFFAHKMINDGEEMGAVIAFVLVVVSYVFSKRINK